MKQLPNIFTLLNLFFGCIAITLVLQNGLVATVTEEGDQVVLIPEQMYWASAFIGIAAVVDYLDGFVARALKATSELGKQLDSLADLVSFGVAPGLIIFQFLRLSYAQQEDGLNISSLWLLPAFIVPCAGAYRLGRFNIDTKQSFSFKGVPIPATGLMIASFPLIYWYATQDWAVSILLSKWFWYALIIIVSYLMTSTLPMIALKFKDLSIKNNLSKFIIVIAGILAAVLLGWLAAPIVFIVYVIISLVMPPKAEGQVAHELIH